MRRYLAIIIILPALLSALPALCWGGQFKITEIYDGTTVRAEGYDTDCLP
ncbi:MAG: hypothetical protein JRI71_02675 [Deltaproteobacteria bacterium]|nr:hypothetical protein [Deltaproteobacteria bacterium]MBW2076449.1 hypothetical protein [Deltaproteobacteria bacterium]